MVLRIEDTDRLRSSRSLEDSILDDLRWLGLDWDEGPDIGGPNAPYRQSERGDVYREHAERLVEEGKAYPCYCSPEELEEMKRKAREEGRAPTYDGTCRNLTGKERKEKEAEGRRPALRFRVPDGDIEFEDLLHGKMRFSSSLIGDFLIMRSDGTGGFNFSVVVDDATMDISHVIRGEDHLTNTARHVLLFQALGFDVPLYLHHSLLMGPDGAKMSKRHGATAVRDYRETGYLPQALDNYLALLSWSPPEGREVLALSELMRVFDIHQLSASPAVFDKARLDWLNGRHLRGMQLQDLVEKAGPYAPRWSGHPLFPLMLESVLDNLSTLGELPDYLEVYGERAEPGEKARAWLRGDAALRILKRASRELESNEIRSLDDAREVVGRLKQEFLEKDFKVKEVLMPVRVALTGRERGPALPYLLAVLGGRECIERLRGALAAMEDAP